MTQYELESPWISADGIAGVRYRFGDLVLVQSGDYSGQLAVVVSWLSIDPEPVYVLELPRSHSEVLSGASWNPQDLQAGELSS